MSDARQPYKAPSARARARLERVVSSGLWAAWADALGFISELADEAGVRRRTHGQQLLDVMPWTRRVGGRGGVSMDLPAGTYSDDTQLRLASARAISGHGFDVEAFARIELTLWPAYSLGGGRASKAAAAAMTKASAAWPANFYDGWTNAGGNGAAMRIQPHVWAARSLESRSYLRDVMRDSVVTHGHPRALLGAALHAASIGHALRTESAPGVYDWDHLLNEAASADTVLETDPELAHFWLPQWEAVERRRFSSAWSEALDEVHHLLVELRGPVLNNQAPHETYRQVVEQLRLRAPDQRGSGTVTVVASLALAALFPESAREAAIASSNAIGTDTDTIATMAAAVVGAANPGKLPDKVQDRVYLVNEAERLVRISEGQEARQFPYPDLLQWSPPQSQLDAVGIHNGRAALAGMGWLDWIGEPRESREAAWRWAHTSFGPTVLVKYRHHPRDLRPGNLPLDRELTTGAPARRPTADTRATAKSSSSTTPLFEIDETGTVSTPRSGQNHPRSFDELVGLGLTDERVGATLRRIINGGNRDEYDLFVHELWKHVRR